MNAGGCAERNVTATRSTIARRMPRSARIRTGRGEVHAGKARRNSVRPRCSPTRANRGGSPTAGQQPRAGRDTTQQYHLTAPYRGSSASSWSNPEKFERERASDLGAARQSRSTADYDAGTKATEDEPHEECERAARFLTEMQQYLRTNGLREENLQPVPPMPGQENP